MVPSQGDALAPTLWELGALALLTALTAILLLFDGPAIVNLLSPLALIAILGLANWDLARRSPEAMWTPIFAYRAAAIIYFGVGGFLPSIYDAFTLEYVLSTYPYQPSEAAKAHLIWLSSSALLLGGARAASAFMGPLKAQGGRRAALGLGAIGLAFFTIGFGAFLGLALPATLGIFSVLLPGSFVNVLEGMTAGGVFLISMWAFERGRRGYLVIALLFAATSVAGLVSLNKSLVILPQVMISLAYLMRGLRLHRLVVVLGSLALTLSILQPMIAYGRDVHVRSYGDLSGGTVKERLGYSLDWARGARDDPRIGNETINPLSRLDYINVATYAISRYDARQPSESIESALFSIIPRVIWPNKPQTTAINSDLYYELTGHEGSAVSTTVPADVYWNLGWAGILMLVPLLGLPLMIASARCHAIVVQRDWLMMPFVLVCFRTAIAIDGQFVNSIFAPMVMSALLYVMLQAAGSLLDVPGAAGESIPRLR